MKAIIYKPQQTARRLKLYLPYNMKKERELVKTIQGSCYHAPQKLWSVPNTDKNKLLLKGWPKGKHDVNTIQEPPKVKDIVLNKESEQALSKANQKLILKGYSENTIKSYIWELRWFFRYFEQYGHKNVSKEQIESYIYMLITKYKISESRQNGAINAIKFYFEQVLGLPREYYDIQRPKKSFGLPNTLSVEEVYKLLNVLKNKKHRAILYTIYSAGLRLSELLNLRVIDVRSDEGYLFIKGAKGKKDRHTVLSPLLLEVLREYYREFRPGYWLFEGQDGGKYSATSVQKTFRRAQQKSGVNPWSTPHTLRHSFATHLLESGENLRNIQEQMGHNSSKTTERYTHVVGINNKKLMNPLDIMTKRIRFGENGTLKGNNNVCTNGKYT
jgi:integrase/recombinase XerD